jgi:hypothetical protein
MNTAKQEANGPLFSAPETEQPKKTRKPRTKKVAAVEAEPERGIEITSENNGGEITALSQPEAPQLSAEEVAKQTRESFRTASLNLHATFGGKPFNIYKIVRNTGINDAKEAAELMGVLVDMGLAEAKGKGINAVFTVILRQEDQVTALKKRINFKQAEIINLYEELKALEAA